MHPDLQANSPQPGPSIDLTLPDMAVPLSGPRVVVGWRLTAATCHLLSELSWWTGERRSHVVARLLIEALWSSSGSKTLGGRVTPRSDLRVLVQLRLPVVLVDLINSQALGRGWPVELLIEHLAAEYLAHRLGLLAAQRVAPLRELALAADVTTCRGRELS